MGLNRGPFIEKTQLIAGEPVESLERSSLFALRSSLFALRSSLFAVRSFSKFSKSPRSFRTVKRFSSKVRQQELQVKIVSLQIMPMQNRFTTKTLLRDLFQPTLHSCLSKYYCHPEIRMSQIPILIVVCLIFNTHIYLIVVTMPLTMKYLSNVFYCLRQ